MIARPARVWALVVLYGGEEITAACIESLLAQDHRDLSILLIDNSSADGIGARLRARFPSIAYLDTGGNLGYGGGNNRGFEHALREGCEYVLVANNDTVLEPTCVSRLVATAQSMPQVGLVSPKILYFDDPTRIWFGGGEHASVRGAGRHLQETERDRPGEPAVAREITFATGCVFLMPADVVRQVAGFSEDFFMYCEDLELALRLRDAGYRMYYQPGARVYHREPSAPREPSAFQIRMRDRNRRRVVRRHYGPLERLRFAAWFYPTRVVRLSQYVLRGDWDRARAVIAGAIER